MKTILSHFESKMLLFDCKPRTWLNCNDIATRYRQLLLGDTCVKVKTFDIIYHESTFDFNSFHDVWYKITLTLARWMLHTVLRPCTWHRLKHCTELKHKEKQYQYHRDILESCYKLQFSKWRILCKDFRLKSSRIQVIFSGHILHSDKNEKLQLFSIPSFIWIWSFISKSDILFKANCV